MAMPTLPTKGGPKAPTGAPRRPPWRERFSLTKAMTWTMVISILAAGLVVGDYAMNVLYENKLVDTWAIMFLELEHEGGLLAGRLAGEAKGLERLSEDSDAALTAAADGTLAVAAGGFAGAPALKDFGLAGTALPENAPPLMALRFEGATYLARVAPRPESGVPWLLLRRVTPRLFGPHPPRPASEGALYILTREGRLLYANDPGITSVSVTARPLVQRFIAAPIKQGQVELTGGDGEAIYGFFLEVPGTNLVMFSEVPRRAALAPVTRVVWRFLVFLVLVVVAAALLIQLPLARLLGPVRELAQLALRLGEGRFDVRPRQSGVGELHTLTTAFGTMAAGLALREQEAVLLLSEQAEKARLSGELAIARRIQKTLLPAAGLPAEAGLTVAAEYMPAAECAGDWYHFVYDPARRETVMVIADVSGHGAGASMFTAIIAGLFDDFRSQAGDRFDLTIFARRANDLIYRLGRGEWHVTMAMARHSADAAELDLLVAGHPPPILRMSSGADIKRLPAGAGPDPVLGLSLEFSARVDSVPFPTGASALFYTDGLTEAKSSSGRSFTRRQVKAALGAGHGEPRDSVRRLGAAWRAHLDGAPATDDVCVVVMRAA